jgi:hypothetical protein
MVAPDYARFLSPPTDDAQASPPAPPAPTDASEPDLASKLDAVTARALDKLDELLALPTDTTDGNRTRAQTAAANTVLNTQTRVDEVRLRTSSSPDIMSKLIVEEEKEKVQLQERAEGGLTEDQPWTPQANARPR